MRALLLCVLPLALWAAAPPVEPPLRNSEPLTPDRELKTFHLPPGFRAELVASEPNVVDPVAMAFDERGRLFVAEMMGYPNGGRGTGEITSGRIRLLEDRDGDGVYETSRVWAEGLRFPTGLLPWRGGLLVANAPDLIYLEDTKGTGKADRKRVLYTGFDVANIQQLLNSLTFHFDGWVYANAGGAGGTITCPEKKDFVPVALRGRGIRFDPDVPGSLEPTSGGGQYGLASDDWGRWFTATNSQHLRHIILPDDALRRNPSLAVGATTLDIPEHGAACKVFRRSPFEAWRVERTTRRAGSADAKRFPKTELVPGGYATSACSPLVYNAGLFPKEYRGSVFICDPANNVIMRDTLTPKGATFVAKRGHADSEFLASTDNWFRPVWLTLGPDGAMYVLDFYREVIETPLSLPPDILRRVIVNSRGRGRIWRITTAKPGTKPPRVALDRATPPELTAHLASDNPWWRLTAQRLLQQSKAVPREADLPQPLSAVARLHVLWARARHGAAVTSLLRRSLDGEEPGLREQLVRLAARYPEFAGAVVAKADDPDSRVRFQAALSLGDVKTPEATAALARLAVRADNDTWTQSAILSSMTGRAADVLMNLPPTAPATIKSRLASLVGAGGNEAELARALTLLGKAGKEPTAEQLTLLDGLVQGLAQSGRSLAGLLEKPPAALAGPVGEARKLFEQAAERAGDGKRPAAERAAAVRLLARGAFDPLAKLAPGLLAPRAALDVQLAAVRALSAHDRPEVAKLVLAGWGSAGPTLRREMTEALFARPARVEALVEALEKKAVLPTQLEPARLAALRKASPRAAKALAGAVAPKRAKVVEDYQEALKLEGDAARGKKVFAKACVACHRLENVGVQVGADLLAALRNKTADQLLIDVLDPSREVDPRFLAYQVRTKRGQTLTGIVTADTATSMTLKRGEGAEDTVLRTQIDEVSSTGQSLMPEGLESQINKQDMADLIRYLLTVTAKP